MNIAILGYGIEGESVYNYYHVKFPEAIFTIYDNNPQPKKELPAGVRFVGSRQDFKGINADLAIKTPAIPPWQVEVTGEVTTMTREFIKACPVPVIGVTGTKGKGTTASLIQSILVNSRRKAWLVGNIGVGAFDILNQIEPSDLVVYELSSFQLWDIDVSPQVAVVLGIEPEHLDVHKDFEDYLSAKSNIAKHQKASDVVIYRQGNQYTEQIANLSPSTRKVVYPAPTTAHVQDGAFYYGDRELFSVAALKLVGEHNRDNACAAIDAIWPWVQDGFDIEKGVEAFEGLPHRLKMIGSVNDIRYYDDSISTTPGSTIAAINAFSEPKVLIIGGSNKGASYDELAKKIKDVNDIRRVLLIGSEAKRIEESLKQVAFTRYVRLDPPVTMSDIVKSASTSVEPGDVVILSPACASFDMFRDYADRGDQFIQAVQSL